MNAVLQGHEPWHLGTRLQHPLSGLQSLPLIFEIGTVITDESWLHLAVIYSIDIITHRQRLSEAIVLTIDGMDRGEWYKRDQVNR